MALLRCDYFSEVLEVGTTMTVLLPQESEEQIGVSGGAVAGDPPVLYLLHGLSDDATAWQRYTSIERYAAELGVAVVMPQGGRSFYADEVHGARYWTHLTQELPDVVSSFFRVSDRREDTFVAGLSMGGYGALKWALHEPDRFAAVASLSGAVDVRKLLPERPEILRRVFDGRVGPDVVLEDLLRRHPVGELPPVFVGCGTDDALYADNVQFAEQAVAAGLDVHTDYRPGGHEWALWDSVIRDVLAWLPLRR